MNYKYKAFGLRIMSEIEIPEFLPHSFNEPEILISIKPVPSSIKETTTRGVLFEGSHNEFLLHVPNTGSIYVTRGRVIHIEKKVGASWDDLRVFLLSSGMGALLHQRKLLPMHASTVRINDTVLMFMGNSGTGKSTLAAAFEKKGASVLADDISLIQPKNEAVVIMPSFPQLKLWADAIQKLEETAENMKKVRAELGKYWKNIDNRFIDKPLSPKVAFALSPVNNTGFSVKEMQGIEKFNLLRNNTYKIRFIQGTGLEKEHFTNISKLANNIILHKIERPSGSFELHKLVDVILEQLNAPVH